MLYEKPNSRKRINVLGTSLEIKTDRSVAGDSETLSGKRDGNVMVTVKILKAMQCDWGT